MKKKIFDTKEFRDKIETYRKKKGFKKIEMAQMLNITPSHYTYLITGTRRPTYPILKLVKHRLGIDPCKKIRTGGKRQEARGKRQDIFIRNLIEKQGTVK